MELPQDISSCHNLISILLKKLQLFEEQLACQQEQLAAQQALLIKQEQEIVCLKVRLNKNSRNSHEPSSREGYGKKPAFPKNKGKKRGGQTRHKGNTLQMVSHPDTTIVLPLEGTCTCGIELSTLDIGIHQKRQVFDITTRLEVVEYAQSSGTCNCGKCHYATFPSAVKSPTQYGNGVRTFTTLLTQDYNVSIHKTKQLFIDLFGYSLNEATIQKNNERCYEALAESEQVIKAAIIASPVGHYDETGLRVSGKLHWLHVACTTLFTYYYIHTNRGKIAIDAADIMGQAQHWAIHDCWLSYFDYENVKHGLCIAHLIRELTALQEQKSKWSGLFKDFLWELYEITDSAKAQLTPFEQKKASVLYDEICRYADNLEPLAYKQKGQKGRTAQTKGRNVLHRLIKYKDAFLAFAYHKEVPFTNNWAERALRPAKTKIKVAGSLRTFKGAERYARIRSFIDTARKQNLNVFTELKSVFIGKPFLIK
ncbi:MAG: IS66 family transposase [Chitinophagales bacterium]